MRPKTARRLTLLAVVAVVGIGGGIGVVVVRKWRTEQRYDQYRTEGLAAHQRGDHAVALDPLNRYIRGRDEHRQDAEVLLAFAESRLAVEEVDGNHIAGARTLFQQYVELRPDDEEAMRTLLGLEVALGLHVEAADRARSLLPDDPQQWDQSHVPLLDALTAAELERQRYAEVKSLCARWREIEPQSVSPHMRMIAMFSASDDRSGLEQYVRGLLDESPDDPTAQLVAAVKEVLSGGSAQQARSLVCQATGLSEEEPVIVDPDRVPTEAANIRVALHALDTLRLHDHTMALLEATPEPTDDLVILRLRRLWQRGDHEQVVEVGAELLAEPEEAPATALGLLGLSLVALDRSDEAGALADVLEQRGRDFTASAWKVALRAAADPSLEDDARFEARREAAAADPYEPVLKVRYASALFDRARYSEARRTAAEITGGFDSGPYLLSVSGWNAPVLLRAECHLREGNPQEAFKLARSIGSRDASAVVIALEAAVAMREGGAPVPQLGDLRTVVESALEMAQLEDERARDMAERAVVAAITLTSEDQLAGALDLVAEAQPEFSADAYGRLATIADAAGIEADERLQARSAGSSSAVMTEARRLAAEGDVEAGVRLIEEAFAGDEDRILRSKAVLLEPHDEPRAAAMWIAYADAQPQDLERQRQALRSRAVSLDADWVEGAAKRIAELTGNPVRPERVVRVARARAAIRSATEEQRAQAIASLAAVAADYPDHVPLQLELASVLLTDDPAAAPERDVRLAMAALERAAAAAPHRFDIALQTARVQAMLGDPQAQARLVPLARDEQAPQQVRLEAIAALRDLGQIDQAISVLQSSGASDVASLVMLAELFRQRSEDHRARAIYDALAELPDEQTTPALIERLASFYSSIGETVTASDLIARLSRLEAPPEQIVAARAAWANRFGSVDEINSALEAWVQLAPDDPSRWTQWMQALARSGATEEVDRIAVRAAEAVGPEAAGRIEAMRRTLSEPALSAGVLADLKNLTADSRQREVFAAASEILEAPAAEQTPDAWRAFSARFPRSELAQRLAVQQLAAIGAVDEAIRIGQDQMRSSSSSAGPELPRTVFELLSTRRGRWSEALEAATLWRSRERVAPVEADVAVARAQLELGRAQQAEATLRPHVRRAKLDPASTRDSSLLNLYATSLVRSGNPHGAVDILTPYLEDGGPRFRTLVALEVARSMDTEVAARRLVEAVADIVEARDLGEPDAIVERLGTAMALADVARGTPEPAPLHERSTAMIQSVIDGEDVAPEHRMQAYVVLGESLLTRGDGPGARAAFAKALELAQPNERASIHYRIGRAHQADGDTEAALAEIRTAASDAEAPPQIVLTCAGWFESAGAYEDAFAAYDRILSMPGLPRETVAAVGNNLVMAGVAMGVTDAATLRRLELIARENATDESLSGDLRAEAPSTLAWILLRAGKAEEAAELFQAEVDDAGPRPSVVIGLARALQQVDQSAAQEVAASARSLAADAESIAPWMQGELAKLPQS